MVAMPNLELVEGLSIQEWGIVRNQPDGPSF